MKIKLLFTFLLFLTATVLHAQLASEKFNYPAGTAISTTNGGSGWAEPWQIVTGTDPVITPGGVSSEPVLRETTGNSLFLDQAVGNTRMKRDLATPITDDGGVYWLSFFADFTNVEGGNTMNVMLVNNSAEQLSPNGANGQFIQIGKSPSAGKLAVGLGTVRPGFRFIDVDGAATQANWFVARIEMSGNADPDVVRLFLNPEPGTEPAVGTEVAELSSTFLNDGFQAIGIKIEGSPLALQAQVDDIYLGSSYSAVVPNDLVTITPAPAPAFDNFSYTAGQTINPENAGLGAAENGWAGPWQSRVGEATVVDDDIENYYLLKATSANALELNHDQPADVRLFRRLETPYADDGRTYWLGFWYTARFTGTGEVFQVMLGDVDNYGTAGPGGQALRAGINFDSRNFKVFTGDGTHDTGIAGDTTRWAVLKIETSGNADADMVHVFIDPTPGAEPANNEAAVSFSTSALNNGWNGIMAKVSGPTITMQAILDNLYVGNSFVDITPGDLTDLEPLPDENDPVAAYEPFAYPAGETLADKGTDENGWGGPWVKQSGEDISIQEGSLETDITISEGNSAAVNYTNASAGMLHSRPLTARYPDDGGSLWLSFVMDFEAAPISTEFQVVLQDDQEEIVGFGRTSGFNRIGFTWSPEIYSFVSNTNADGRNWVVARIDFSGDAGPEDIYMWVNPDPFSQPASNQAVASTVDSRDRLAINNGVSAIGIKVFGTAPLNGAVDELRVGSSFGEVSKLEEDLPENLLSRERFRYGVGESIVGLGAANSQWGSAWREGQGGGGGQGVIAEGSLASATAVATDGNRLEVLHDGGANTRFERDFAEFVEDDGNTYWLSFLAQYEASTLSGVNQVFIMNGSGSFNSPQDQRIGIGRAFNDENISIIAPRTGEGKRLTNVAFGSGVQRLVTRISLTGTEEPDTLWLWVNPDPTIEPDTANADAKIATTALNDGFDGVMVKAETGGNGNNVRFVVDELLFGSTYASVSEVGSDEPLGYDDELAREIGLSVYPNPVGRHQSVLKLDFTLLKPQTVALSVYSTTGQVVYAKKGDQFTAGEHTLEVPSTMPAGMYICRLQIGSQWISRKILVNK